MNSMPSAGRKLSKDFLVQYGLLLLNGGRPAEAARSYQQFLAVAPPHLVAQIQDARQRVQELKPA